MSNNDPYFKKNIAFRYRGHNLSFNISQSLFSSQDIDIGTKRLLKTMVDNGIDNYKKVLDLGCGYAPIGISLKVASPSSEMHAVDKDALAIKYTRENAVLNSVSDIKVYGSLGYDDVSDCDFDLIVSNIPAKVGDKVLSHMLKDARFHLKSTGKVAVVVIDAIGEYVTQVLNDPNIKILLYKRWPGHLVFIYKFLPIDDSRKKDQHQSFKSGLYDRGVKEVFIENSRVSIKTTYNLPEFDTLSFETDILIRNLKILKGKSINHVIIFNPGQGFIPVVLSKIATIKRISLIDRDLQALRISKENLVLNKYSGSNISIFHQVGLLNGDLSKADYIVGILSEKDGSEVHVMFVQEAEKQLTTNGAIILASGSTPITRIASQVNAKRHLHIIQRSKLKGRSMLFLKKEV